MMDGSKIYLPQDDISCPQIQLYSQKEIHLEWKKTHKIGAGLVNLGNTCFMNTVIQCLTYCPPLANYLLHDNDHASECKIVGFCMMCELQKHMTWTLDRPGEVVKPLYIYQKLKSIAKHFQFGRQEDAHEFLCYVVDNLWRASLFNIDDNVKLDSSKENTVVNHIFGGYFRSQVLCLRCQERSNTYDHFMDIIVDIKNIHSLEKALEKFVQPELLQNDDAYRCPKCRMKVSAQKRFTVHRAPNVATFQFRRFHYNQMLGGKITKHVIYPEKLNLRPYMSDTKGAPLIYRLNAVLVHMGSSCNSGHYFCYVRNSNGLWYIMDDARVQQVSLNQVLSQQAYVLFYIKTSRENKKPYSACLLNHSLLRTVKHSTRDKCTHQLPRNCSSKSSCPVKQLSGPTVIDTSLTTTAVNGIINGTTYTKEPLSLTPQQKKETYTFGSKNLHIRKDKNPGVSDSKFISKNITELGTHAENSSHSCDNEKSYVNGNKQTNTHSTSLNFPSRCISSIEKTQTLHEEKLPIEKESDNDVVNFNQNNIESEILIHKPDYLCTKSSISVKATSFCHVSDGSLYSPLVSSGSSTNINVTDQQEFLLKSKGNRVVSVWKDTLNELETLAEKPVINNCLTEKGKHDSGQSSVNDLPCENKDNVIFHHQTAESKYPRELYAIFSGSGSKQKLGSSVPTQSVPFSVKDVKTLTQHNNEKSKDLCLRSLTQDFNDQQQHKEKDKTGELESGCNTKPEFKVKCELDHSSTNKYYEIDFPTCSKSDTHLLPKKYNNMCCLESEYICGNQQEVDKKQTNKLNYMFTEQNEQSSENNNFTCLHREQKLKTSSNVDLSQTERNLQSESKFSQLPLTETSERQMKLNSNQNFPKQSSIYDHESTEPNQSQEKTGVEYKMNYTFLGKNQQNYCNVHKEYLKQDNGKSDATTSIKTIQRSNETNQSQAGSNKSNDRAKIETANRSECGYNRIQSRADSSDNESNTCNKTSENNERRESKAHTYDNEGIEISHSNTRKKQSKEDSGDTATCSNKIRERFKHKQGNVKHFKIKSSDIKAGDSYEETLEREKKETIQSNNQNVNHLEKNPSQLGQIISEGARYKQQELQNDERCEKGKVKNMKKRHFDSSFSYTNLFQKLYNHKRERKDHHITESHKHHHGDLNHRMDYHNRLRHALNITFNFGGKQKYR